MNTLKWFNLHSPVQNLHKQAHVCNAQSFTDFKGVEGCRKFEEREGETEKVAKKEKERERERRMKANS